MYINLDKLDVEHVRQMQLLEQVHDNGDIPLIIKKKEEKRHCETLNKNIKTKPEQKKKTKTKTKNKNKNKNNILCECLSFHIQSINVHSMCEFQSLVHTVYNYST